MKKPDGLLSLWVSMDGQAVFSMWSCDRKDYPKSVPSMAKLQQFNTQTTGDTLQMNSFPSGRTLCAVTSIRYVELDNTSFIKFLSKNALEYAKYLGWEPGDTGPKVLYEGLYEDDLSRNLSRDVYNKEWGPTK